MNVGPSFSRSVASSSADAVARDNHFFRQNAVFQTGLTDQVGAPVLDEEQSYVFVPFQTLGFSEIPIYSFLRPRITLDPDSLEYYASLR